MPTCAKYMLLKASSPLNRVRRRIIAEQSVGASWEDLQLDLGPLTTMRRIV
jgi:hypothetical protein